MPYADKTKQRQAQAESQRRRYHAEWHQKNKERRNAAALANYYAKHEAQLEAKRKRRANMTPAEREAVKARDRAYRATRKEKDKAYQEANKAKIRAQRRARYHRLKAQRPKRNVIATARRLVRKAQVRADEARYGIVRVGAQ